MINIITANMCLFFNYKVYWWMNGSSCCLLSCKKPAKKKKKMFLAWNKNAFLFSTFFRENKEEKIISVHQKCFFFGSSKSKMIIMTIMYYNVTAHIPHPRIRGSLIQECFRAKWTHPSSKVFKIICYKVNRDEFDIYPETWLVFDYRFRSVFVSGSKLKNKQTKSHKLKHP